MNQRAVYVHWHSNDNSLATVTQQAQASRGGDYTRLSPASNGHKPPAIHKGTVHEKDGTHFRVHRGLAC